MATSSPQSRPAPTPAAPARRGLPAVIAGHIGIAPSVLAADFTRLGEEAQRVENAGADVLHIDVMDGHFVPNLSMGPAIVAALRRACRLPLDVHLMLSEPERYVEAFAKAGADHITVHAEITADLPTVLAQIHATGCSAGVSLRPHTPAAAVAAVLHDVELVLVMSVEPGFGGQSFMRQVLPKITELRRLLNAAAAPVHLEVDGGIDSRTAPEVIAAGANLLVAGTSVFSAPRGAADAIRALRRA